MAATLKQLAAEARVSVTTASIVINGRGKERSISAQTVERVLKAAAALNYAPNLQAKSLRTRRTMCVGVVATLPLDSHTGRIVAGITGVCRARDYRCILTTIGTGDDPCREVDAVLNPNAVDGLIVIDRGLDFAEAELRALAAAPRPVVIAGRLLAGAHSCCDDFTASGRNGTEHLYANGYDDILYLGIRDDLGFAAFMAGARQAAAAAGREIPAARCQELVQREYPMLRPDTTDSLPAILAAGLPQAIVCFGDRITYGAHRTLIRSGLALPGDIALLGYGDYEGNFNFLTPSVSAIRPALGNLGVLSATRLLDMITDADGAYAWPLHSSGDVKQRASSQHRTRTESAPVDANKTQ